MMTENVEWSVLMWKSNSKTTKESIFCRLGTVYKLNRIMERKEQCALVFEEVLCSYHKGWMGNVDGLIHQAL